MSSSIAVLSYILKKDEYSATYNSTWRYRSVIEKLNYLEKGTRPDIDYATHQCAQFTEYPRTPHAKAVEVIIKYLKKNNVKEFHSSLIKKSLEVYANADFSGNW